MTEQKRVSVKSKVEAVLFSTGHRISLDEISRLCRAKKEEVLTALKELQQEYEAKQSSLMLVEEGEFWKFTVRDHFIPIVRKIVTETELTKSVLETLAVIAFKYPILQSDLIKIRTNKAYEHLVELEKSGYISRQKHGRTNLIKLTEKFFKYFELTEEKLKDKFQDFESIARAIKEKEEEIESIKEEQRKKAEDLKKEDERIKKEIEELDKGEEEFEVPLDIYEAKPEKLQKEVESQQEEIGLEIVEAKNEKTKDVNELPKIEEPKLEEKENKVNEAKTEINQQETQQNIQLKNKPKAQRKPKGIKLTPEMEAKVEKRVQEIMEGEKQENEEKK